jgi:hypothetical protein
MHAWNKIHGEKLLLEQDGVIQHDIPKMIELWKITKLVNRCRKDEDGEWHTMIGCDEKN